MSFFVNDGDKNMLHLALVLLSSVPDLARIGAMGSHVCFLGHWRYRTLNIGVQDSADHSGGVFSGIGSVTPTLSNGGEAGWTADEEKRGEEGRLQTCQTSSLCFRLCV